MVRGGGDRRARGAATHAQVRARRAGAGINDSLRGVRPPFCSSVVLSLCLALAGPGVHAAAPSAASTTPGGEVQRLVVLPLRVDGQLDAETRERWSEGLRKGLERGDAELVDPATV